MKKDSLFSRLLGNPILLFLVFLLCWVPVWLAFYPGNLQEDAVTQFYTYWDEMHSAHHPLLHTLLLGVCLSKGIDLDPDGCVTPGIAIYSVVQMALMAVILSIACWWLKKRCAPLWSRITVTLLFALFPFYSMWSYAAQKDVLFAGMVLLLVLQLADLWRNGSNGLRAPWRVLLFVITAVLMMLLRNNGMYAFLLLTPFAVLLAKNHRVRTAAVMLVCVVLYLLANHALIAALDAEDADSVEMMSIPLQQMARTLRDNEVFLTEEEQFLMDSLYPNGFVEYYEPQIADPVKWALDYDTMYENIWPAAKLWMKLGLKYPGSYLAAFWDQNKPYLVPYQNMLYHFDLGIVEMDLFPVEEQSYFPKLRTLYEEFDQTLTLWGIPLVRLLSDAAVYVWLMIALIILSIRKKQFHWLPALGFLAAIWLTCLLGPVALMRYLLSLYYAIPVLGAAMLAKS